MHCTADFPLRCYDFMISTSATSTLESAAFRFLSFIALRSFLSLSLVLSHSLSFTHALLSPIHFVLSILPPSSGIIHSLTYSFTSPSIPSISLRYLSPQPSPCLGLSDLPAKFSPPLASYLIFGEHQTQLPREGPSQGLSCRPRPRYPLRFRIPASIY